ncbi:DUF1707 domain-containing protein [Amycolatopsis sp. NPDC059027]|uniref:DUF1707 SHOCT-like domain-containing protein n=1 Tax=unclassified Amycolatopsis TaxID=2618356 RepID=UPI003670C6CA
MNEVPSPELRISDRDRETALTALGEHMSAGRIDIDEFGERSAQITAAKTRGDLVRVFADLPEPHPRFDETWQAVSAPPVPQATAQPPAAPGATAWSPAQRVLAGMLPLVWIAAILLMVTTGISWLIILVPIGLTAVGKSLWGQDWHGHDRHRRELRDRRRYRGEVDG